MSVPHEVGHSLGRRHAPCRGCTPAAQNPDDSFPQYNTFNSDSIGAFGFDAATNTVLNPASTLDFMTAFLPTTAWISPYTYGALVGPIQGGPTAGGSLTYLGGHRMTLFLRLEIGRDRDVTRECSFAYPAPPQGGAGCASGFHYEFLDGEGRTLDCGPLTCPCDESGCDCWPRRIRDALPMPDGARTFCVREGDAEIYREEIPDPPKVKILGHDCKPDGVHLRWRSDAGEDSCCLVHVRDPRGEAFRGLSPRFHGASAVIPRGLFADGPRLEVRVLVSSGLATGVASATVELDDFQPPEVELRLLGVEAREKGPNGVTPVVSVLATDQAGRQLSDERISWYDDDGTLLAQGAQLDLRSLPKGRRRVRAVARGHGGRTIGTSWLLERSDADFVMHARIDDPPRSSRDAPHEHPHPKPERPAGGQEGEPC